MGAETKRLAQAIWIALEAEAFFKRCLRFLAGASLLAKNSQAPRSFRQPALSLTFFASKLAPTSA
ncbi:hypothetical protein CYL20_14230 [Pseudomonas palleroniana]|uniref:Uncharacterized protein n=1 Tax=Pseudomonas palleroniana TaxID=191390 RepID=A0A2L1JAZ9_9PSED|nr:hypothetical protein CYL20_14230 [Pseudomonas palleroniana]